MNRLGKLNPFLGFGGLFPFIGWKSFPPVPCCSSKACMYDVQMKGFCVIWLGIGYMFKGTVQYIPKEPF